MDPSIVRSVSLGVTCTPAERDEFQARAVKVGVTASALARRLLGLDP